MTTSDLVPNRRPVPEELFGGRLRGAYLLDLEVTRVDDLAPHVRSVTFGSGDLVGFEYVPGQDLMIEFPGGASTVRRRYTIRRADPVRGTADLEFELHDGGGVAAEWARAAGAGDRLSAIGPRGSALVPFDAPAHLLIADDSAMPAAFAVLEALAPDVPATAILVTPHGAGSRPAPPAGPRTRLQWVDPAGLGDVLAAVALPAGVAVSVNGERQLVLDALARLGARGLARDGIAWKAYWRADQPNAAHGEPARD